MSRYNKYNDDYGDDFDGGSDNYNDNGWFGDDGDDCYDFYDDGHYDNRIGRKPATPHDEIFVNRDDSEPRRQLNTQAGRKSAPMTGPGIMDDDQDDGDINYSDDDHDEEEKQEEEEEAVPAVVTNFESYETMIDYDNADDAILDEVDKESFREEDGDEDDDNEEEEEEVNEFLFDDDSAYDNGVDVDFVDTDGDDHYPYPNRNDSDNDACDFLEDGYGDDQSQHYDNDDKEYASNYYFRNSQSYVKDKLQITKQSLLGGPITSVLILPITTTTTTTLPEYDVLYGQGPYLHHIPHESWIRRHQVAASETTPSCMQQSHPKSTTTKSQQVLTKTDDDDDDDDDDVPLLVFPNGGTIHGIRDYGYDDHINQHVMLLFGGRQLAFVRLEQQQRRRRRPQRTSPPMHRIIMNDLDQNDIDTNDKNNRITDKRNNEAMGQQSAELSDDELLYQQFKIDVAKVDFSKSYEERQKAILKETEEKHQKELQELSKIQYHAMLDDWIWDCRVVPMRSLQSTTVSTLSLNESSGDSMSEENYGDDENLNEKQPEAMIIIGLAHQQIEICALQLMHTTEPMDKSTAHDVVSVVEISLRRLQSIKNHTIPKCIAYSMNIWMPTVSLINDTRCDPNVMIASGTVSNTICVWELVNVSPESSQTMACVILDGHEGVIHAVRFHDSGQYIISTSDDRTVRMWERVDENDSSPQWKLKWTAYGHTARGWDVAFCHLSNTTTTACHLNPVLSNYTLDGTVVLSTGEDGTMRIWDARNGDALASIRGHACQCIWRVATIESNRNDNPINRCCGFTITTGNDGTVAFYDIRNAIPSLWWDAQLRQPLHDQEVYATSMHDNDEREAGRQCTFVVPNDYCVNDTIVNGSVSVDATNTTPTKRKKKDMRQTVIGMKITKQRFQNDDTDERSNDENRIGLIVAARSGSMWYLAIDSGVWTELDPWNVIHHSNQTKSNHASISEGNCICVHPNLPIVAVGTANGDIVLTELVIRNRSGDGATEGSKPISKQCSTVLPAHVHKSWIRGKDGELPYCRSIQGMKWLLPNTLISFHVTTIILWYIPSLCQQKGKSIRNGSTVDTNLWRIGLNDYTVLPMRTFEKGLAISAALNVGQTKLVIGDTRGNLSLFYVGSGNVEDEMNYAEDEEDFDDGVNHDHNFDRIPISTRRGCHQKEHVTDLLWQDWKTVVSVGNDGRICKCMIDSNHQLIQLLSIPVGSFTGISKIWMLSSNNRPSFVVGGYYGNNFATVDSSNGYEFFRADTGGRQRTIDVWMSDELSNALPPPNSIIVATCANRDDGRNEVKLHGRSKGLTSIVPQHDTLVSHSRGIPIHGESIFDIHIFPLDENHRTFGILTGSEDCTARLTIYRGDSALASTSLPPQVSGIRAVCSCRYNIMSTVVVIGGKNSVDLFLVEDIDDTMIDRVAIRYLGSGSPIEKLTIDHRINCVRVTVLRNEDESEFEEGEVDEDAPNIIVVTGDSDGNCYEYQFTKRSFDSCGTVVYKDERPILCLDIIYCKSHYLLFVGGTAGDVAAVHVRLPVEPYHDFDPRLCLLIHAHSIGTNSIAVRTLRQGYRENRDIRIVSCGDDQAICCTDVTISEYGRQQGSVSRCTVKDAALSALKGIRFITDNLVIATGYDQKISVWQCVEKKRLNKVRASTTNFGGVNCFPTYRYSIGAMIKVHGSTADIGDINCFSTCSIGGTRRCNHLLVVGGAGLEVLQLRIKIPKHAKESTLN